jgi:hypothetical protein
LRGEFGNHRTFVPWEKEISKGVKGVKVEEHHAWMYFFDLTKVEQLKKELNKI